MSDRKRNPEEQIEAIEKFLLLNFKEEMKDDRLTVARAACALLACYRVSLMNLEKLENENEIIKRLLNEEE